MNAIRWKGKREKFQSDHAAELRQFYMVRRKLKEAFRDNGELPVTEWQREYRRLCQEYEEEYAAYKPLRTDLMYLLNVKSCVDAALRQDRNGTRENDLEKGKERL